MLSAISYTFGGSYRARTYDPLLVRTKNIKNKKAICLENKDDFSLIKLVDDNFDDKVCPINTQYRSCKA